MGTSKADRGATSFRRGVDPRQGPIVEPGRAPAAPPAQCTSVSASTCAQRIRSSVVRGNRA
jgi:hypothetical protein